jgi:hypothetical protein
MVWWGNKVIRLHGRVNSKIQRFKDSKIQRFKDSKIQRFKDSKIIQRDIIQDQMISSNYIFGGDSIFLQSAMQLYNLMLTSFNF